MFLSPQKRQGENSLRFLLNFQLKAVNVGAEPNGILIEQLGQQMQLPSYLLITKEEIKDYFQINISLVKRSTFLSCKTRLFVWTCAHVFFLPAGLKKKSIWTMFSFKQLQICFLQSGCQRILSLHLYGDKISETTTVTHWRE